MNIPESTYHYHIHQFMKDDPDGMLKEKITTLFYEYDKNYGYRRIHSSLRGQEVKINHKKVQRLMKELNLKCTKFTRKSRRYNSYKGTVGKVSKNLLNRRFNTSVPLQKLVTDITEFKCSGNQKLYLNPILDLYNREIIFYSISNKPTLDLVVKPLNEAVGIINDKATYRTTIHSDQD